MPAGFKLTERTFIILELVLLIPLLIFWIGVFAGVLFNYDGILRVMIGTPPEDIIRSILFVLIFPICAVLLGIYFMINVVNRTLRGQQLAVLFMGAGMFSLGMIFIYLFVENFI